MNKIIVVGIVIAIFVIMPITMGELERSKLGFVIRVDPNVTNINNYYNLSGGKEGSGYLYNDSTTMYLNETMLNDTIDDRATGITEEADPYWTGNLTSCTATQKLYFSSGSLACNNDDDDPESINCGIIQGNTSNLCSIVDTDTDTWNTSEEVQDAVWESGIGTTTRITVTYQDGTDDVDFVVDDMNDDTPDNDAEVPDDITITSSNYVNTTEGMQTVDMMIGGASGWRMYVNASGYLIFEDI